MTLDDIDKRLLTALQQDASESLEKLGERIGLSRNACWNRVRKLEEAGVLKARVALVEPAEINLGLSVFISVRTNEHDPEWSEIFARETSTMPEIQGVYRTSGDLDYLIRARVPDVAAYDRTLPAADPQNSPGRRFCKLCHPGNQGNYSSAAQLCRLSDQQGILAMGLLNGSNVGLAADYLRSWTNKYSIHSATRQTIFSPLILFNRVCRCSSPRHSKWMQFS